MILYLLNQKFQVFIVVVMGSKKCEVCKEAQSKYKCPSCLVP